MIDAGDATFIGMGYYLNEEEKIPKQEDFEESDRLENEEHSDIENIQRMPNKRPLRPFEQHVQASIDKLKKRM